MNKNILDVPFQDLTEVEIQTLLEDSDKFMARVFEDAISAILRLGIIKHRDLPDSAREVLEARAKLRVILEERRITYEDQNKEK